MPSKERAQRHGLTELPHGGCALDIDQASNQLTTQPQRLEALEAISFAGV